MSKRLITIVLSVLMLVCLTLPVSAANADALKVESKHLTPEQTLNILRRIR